MTTGKAFGQLWSHGARDWASFVEPHYQSLYQAVYDRLGITEGTRVLDVGCGPGGAALLASGRGARVAGRHQHTPLAFPGQTAASSRTAC